MFALGWHDEAAGPFESRRFAEAVAARGEGRRHALATRPSNAKPRRGERQGLSQHIKSLGGLRTMKRLALILLLLCTPALAHDANHPELNSWFDHLASGKGLCCSFADGLAVADPDWDSKDGHYRVRLDNEWIDVPDDAVITEPNRTGRTMVWPIKGSLGTSIRCFMPGSMT